MVGVLLVMCVALYIDGKRDRARQIKVIEGNTVAMTQVRDAVWNCPENNRRSGYDRRIASEGT